MPLPGTKRFPKIIIDYKLIVNGKLIDRFYLCKEMFNFIFEQNNIMKKVLIVFAACMFALHAMAQETKPVQKTISVNGSSEIEVVPDEIYVQVDLREYNKKNGDKVD